MDVEFGSEKMVSFPVDYLSSQRDVAVANTAGFAIPSPNFRLDALKYHTLLTVMVQVPVSLHTAEPRDHS